MSVLVERSAERFVAACVVCVLADRLLLDNVMVANALAAFICVLFGDLILNGNEFESRAKRQPSTSNEAETSESVGVARAVSGTIPGYSRPSSTTTSATVQTDEQEYEKVRSTEPSPALEVDAHPDERLLDPIRDLYEDDRPFDAVLALRKLRADGFLKHETSFSSKSRAFIAIIDQADKEIFQLTAALEDESLWKLRMTHKQCEIFASKSDSRDFKVVCACPESSLFNLIAFILETQFYKHWVPGVTHSSRSDNSKFHQNIYLRFAVPFPMKDREVVLKGYGDVWMGSKVMIYVASENTKEAESKLDIKPGALRVDVLFAGMLLKPLEAGGAEITIISRLDLHMAFLPDALFDYAAKFILAELCVYLREKSKAMTKDPHNPKHQMWLDRQKGPQSAVYKEIRERLSKMTTAN